MVVSEEIALKTHDTQKEFRSKSDIAEKPEDILGGHDGLGLSSMLGSWSAQSKHGQLLDQKI